MARYMAAAGVMNHWEICTNTNSVRYGTDRAIVDSEEREFSSIEEESPSVAVIVIVVSIIPQILRSIKGSTR